MYGERLCTLPPRDAMHVSPAATDDAIRLLDERTLTVVWSVETFWRRDLRRREVVDGEEVNGAGYGDRTRVRGLGSLCTTIVLSPQPSQFYQVRISAASLRRRAARRTADALRP
jgi:hypothetical protein